MGGLFSSPGQLALEGQLADLVAQRAVIADAVANVNTPGYQPSQDASFAASLRAAAAQQLGAGGAAGPAAAPGGSAIAGTAPAGAQAIPLSVSPAAQAVAPGGALAGTDLTAGLSAGAVTPDGNGVSLDTAMVALAQTDLSYQAVTRQLQLVYQNLGSAIDVGGA